MHPTHETRFSDSSLYGEVCVNCGATDTLSGWGELANPCPRPVSQGGITTGEWYRQREESIRTPDRTVELWMTEQDTPTE